MFLPLSRPIFAFSVVLAMLLAAPPLLAHGSPADGATLRIAIPLSDPATQLRELRSELRDVHGFNARRQETYAIVSESELERLRVLGYEPRVLEDMTPSEESLEALSDYVSPGEVNAIIDDTVAAYPDIAERFQYDLTTHEGRTVYGIKISDNVATDEAEPRIFFVSQHHAREVMTPEVMVDMIEILTASYSLNDEVTEWVDGFQIYIVPTHNPDGTEEVFAGNTGWRKNRRDNGDGTFGVDPNRNYPYGWGPDGCNGSSGSTSSDTYRGPSAGSEPITESLIALVREWRPSISLTYHTYSELVLHPMGCSPALPDDPDLIAHREIGSMLAASIENDAGNGWYEMGTPYELLYEVDGDSDGWLHSVGGSVAFTIEMNASSQGFQPDYDTWRDDTVVRNRDGWMWLLRRLGRGGVQGEVRDACTGAPLSAEVGVAEQVFTQAQEARTSDPDQGFYHRILEPGEYTWYGSLEGYLRQEWPLGVSWSAETRDLWLVPLGSRAAELRSLEVDDADGDADGELDPGEEALIYPSAYATGEALSGLVSTLSSNDPYLEILDDSAALPDLDAGMEGRSLDAFRVRVLADAPDGHLASATVSFSANETLCRQENEAALRLTKGFPAMPFEEERFDEDPSWTIEGPVEGWEFGAPQGNGSTTGPADAFTGENVYGTNLDGNYGTGEGEFILTTSFFDLQGLRDGELRYRRWLSNEPGYDLARIEVSVDEQEWTEIWRGFGRDRRWEEMRHDLPEFMDGAEQAWIRFVMRQDGGGARFGWFIDDVAIVGENALTAGGRLKFESYRVIENDPLYGNADGALDAGETATMPVTLRSTRNALASGISAILSTEEPGVTIHNGVADYADIDAGSAGESLAPHFTFTTGPGCAARIEFLLEVRAGDGSESTSRFTVPVGTLAPATLFVDDMELDRGWTTEALGTDGEWELGDPHGSSDGSELTNPEDDHGADPEVSAWVTRNVPPPTVVPPTVAEVDGTQILVSPTLAARAFETLELSYWRWFYTGGGPGPDLLRTEVSGDGGFSWRSVDEVGTKANEWLLERHELSGKLEFTDDFVVRFVAVDTGGESIVEAGIDDLELSGEAWFCEDVVLDPLDPPNPLGPTLAVSKRDFDVRLTWSAPPADATHGPATFYSVTRSTDAQGSFGEIGKPSAERYVDVGAAGPSDGETYYYLVTPENNGGGGLP